MIGAVRDGFRDIAPHVVEGLAGDGEDEIEVQAFEARPMRYPGRFARLFRAMNPPEEFENSRLERLRAETQAIYARRPHSSQLRITDRAWICFERDLAVALHAKDPVRRVDHVSDRARLQERRCSTTKQNRLDVVVRPCRIMRSAPHLADQPPRVILLEPRRRGLGTAV